MPPYSLSYSCIQYRETVTTSNMKYFLYLSITPTSHSFHFQGIIYPWNRNEMELITNLSNQISWMNEFERSVPNSTPLSPIRQGSVPNSTAPVPNSTAIGTYSRDRYLFRLSPIRILRYLFRDPVPGVCRQISLWKREVGGGDPFWKLYAHWNEEEGLND